LKKLLFICLVLSNAALFAQDAIIKSLKIYTSNDQNSIPVLTSAKDFLYIDFDVQAEYPPNFNIIFKFCDRNWNPTDNIFLLNQGQNTAFNLDFFTLPTTVEAAKYHYSNRFPDKLGYVSFPFSGKWKFFVVDSQDPSLIFAEGKFFVVKADQPIKIEVKKETLDDKIYYPPQLGIVNWIIAEANLKQDYFPFFVDELEIVQNHILNNPIVVPRNSTDQNRVFEWDGGSKLKFIAKDVRPGNEYREVNLNDINIFNSKNVKAQFDGLEYNRFFIQGKKDLNGSFTLKPPKDMYSTYLNVTFQIKPPEEVYGDIYLVGAFNDWNVSEKYKMNFNGNYYDLTIELKRGVYDYQYVVVNGDPKNPANQDWYILEGNDWATTDEYNIFLWYRDQEYGGYDRIIGYSKIQSR
jgi:hypothetical protein